jgi:fatty-acid desaturase
MQDTFAVESRAGTINWKNVTIISSFHLVAIVALFTFSWQNLAALLIVKWMVGSLGIGVGWHRLLTHRSFRAPKWLEYTLSILATMSIQDSPEKWIATHRIHHKFTEMDGDPHSTRSGFWWAQMGWVLRGTAQDHDEATLKRYVPDLLKDRGHRLISRYYYVPVIISAFILFAIGGWTMVIWGVVARVVVQWHATWFVNSLSHIYGDRPYETADDSTNNWFVALVSFGEGWHNNHHAFPTSARHGLEWFQFDMNWIAIRIFEKLGWATQIKLPEKKSLITELEPAS